MREEVDQTPMEIPEALLRPPSLEERLRQFVQQELSKAAVQDGAGSFEEEDDFELTPDLEDDPDLLTDYQVLDMVDEFDDVEQTRQEAEQAEPAVMTPAEEALDEVLSPEAAPLQEQNEGS